MSERIGERFQILEVLGRGGQATVYAVEDARRPGRQLALKQARDLETAALLRLEFERLRGLDHPGLVRGLEWLDADPGGPGLLCERIHGVPFDRALEAAGPVGSDARREQALAWAGDLLAALEVVHRAGWVHLDLKPANVLVGEGGPVLLDFALAARAGEVAARGTPGYAAPEVLAGWPVDRRADLYGLGALLVHALQGEAPAGDRCLDPGQAPAALAPLLAADRCARPSSAHEVLARWGRELPELEGGLPTLEAPWEGDGSRLAALARPGLTLVSGPAGSGRSRLLREAGFARRLDGARVVHVECATPAPGPWGPLSVLASRLGVEAASGATAEGARARARVQISAGARRYASEGPCVFAFDDLERADPEVLELVVALVRALEDAPAVWLWLAWGAGDLPTALQRLLRTLPGAAQVELGPRARIERAPPPEGGPVRRLLEGLALLGRPLPPEELAAWDPALLASAGAASAGGWARSTPAGFVLQARVEPSAVARKLLELELEPPVAARVALVAQAPGAAEQALREARAALEARPARASREPRRCARRARGRAQRRPRSWRRSSSPAAKDERGLALLEGCWTTRARRRTRAPRPRRWRRGGRYRRAEDARALDLAERAEALEGPGRRARTCAARSPTCAAWSPPAPIPRATPPTWSSSPRCGRRGPAATRWRSSAPRSGSCSTAATG
ncbi:MAG: serine/threonine-protein kinase [Planctomycetota bacterium]